MRNQRISIVALWLSVVGHGAFAQTLPARLAHVTYVTSNTLYVDAGSEEGLHAGQAVEVIRDGRIVASLTVSFVSSHRAACEKRTGEPVRVGDQVRFAPLGGGSEAAPATVEAPPTPAPAAPVLPERTAAQEDSKPAKPRAATRIRGRVGVRYQLVRGGDSPSLSQPALDLRLDAERLFGMPLAANLDVRARRDKRGASGQAENATRIYRAALSYEPGPTGWGASLGRQFSPSLAAISLFDGVSAAWHTPRFGTGGFVGTQPRESDLGFSSDVRVQGLFAEWHQAPQAVRRWSTTIGLIGSYQQSEINREFAYLQGSYLGPNFSAFASQEVDVNRGWRAEAEGKSIGMTSSFLSLRYRFNDAWSVDGGFDNRRNVRLYRDLIDRVTEFDDRFRRGAWAGVQWQFARHYRVGLSGRTSGGGDAGTADSYTASISATEISPLRFDVRARSTRFTSTIDEGWLHALSWGVPIGDWLHVGIDAGRRETTPLAIGTSPTTLTWYGLDADLTLGRHWFGWASWEHDTGDQLSAATDQFFVSAAYRF